MTTFSNRQCCQVEIAKLGSVCGQLAGGQDGRRSAYASQLASFPLGLER
jgi:hypothetical protein